MAKDRYAWDPHGIVVTPGQVKDLKRMVGMKVSKKQRSNKNYKGNFGAKPKDGGFDLGGDEPITERDKRGRSTPIPAHRTRGDKYLVSKDESRLGAKTPPKPERNPYSEQKKILSSPKYGRKPNTMSPKKLKEMMDKEKDDDSPTPPKPTPGPRVKRSREYRYMSDDHGSKEEFDRVMKMSPKEWERTKKRFGVRD